LALLTHPKKTPHSPLRASRNKNLFSMLGPDSGNVTYSHCSPNSRGIGRCETLLLCQFPPFLAQAKVLCPLRPDLLSDCLPPHRQRSTYRRHFLRYNGFGLFIFKPSDPSNLSLKIDQPLSNVNAPFLTLPFFWEPWYIATSGLQRCHFC